jgi:hypothetical protein
VLVVPARRPSPLLAVAAIAGAALALAVGACGGGGATPSAAERAGQAAVAARRIPQGVTLSYTETGVARPTGSLMRPLRTATAAARECGYWHANYVASVYGGPESDRMTPTDYDVTAHAFAVRRAAPGFVAAVQRGCRAGLHP